MSLQYNNSFSKNNGLASALWQPIRTDSKPFRRRFVGKTGFGTSHRRFLPNKFRQSFESSPESRGSQTSGVLLVLFVQAKRIKPFPYGKVPRFSKPRISAHRQKLCTNPIKSFCRFAAFPPPLAAFSLLLSQHFFRLTAVSLPGQRSLPGTFPYFLLDTKSMTKKPL